MNKNVCIDKELGGRQEEIYMILRNNNWSEPTSHIVKCYTSMSSNRLTGKVMEMSKISNFAILQIFFWSQLNLCRHIMRAYL